MDAITKGAVFTDEEMHKGSGEATVKQDARSGRFIIHRFTPGAGHVLRISGRGVPANFIVSTDGEHVNVLARILLNAVYDARVIR
jgi:hypothetical protein